MLSFVKAFALNAIRYFVNCYMADSKISLPHSTSKTNPNKKKPCPPIKTEGSKQLKNLKSIVFTVNEHSCMTGLCGYNQQL